MALDRILETEVMDTAEEARSYDQIDHLEVNTRFVADFLKAHGPCRGGAILDIGTGTARIPIELCQRDPKARVVATDLADHMLALAARNVEAAALSDRIRLLKSDAKVVGNEVGEPIEAVISNSIIHHIPDPTQALISMMHCASPGATVFVRDLARPSTTEELQRLVNTHAAGAPEQARRLLADSLHAALTEDEVREMLKSLGVVDADVRMTSDRHWTWTWKVPSA